MKPRLRAVAVAVLAIGGLAGIGAGRAEAQPGVPYGPYSMTRSQFNQYAPVYYPRLINNYGIPYYSRVPRYYPMRRRYNYNNGNLPLYGGPRYW